MRRPLRWGTKCSYPGWCWRCYEFYELGRYHKGHHLWTYEDLLKGGFLLRLKRLEKSSRDSSESLAVLEECSISKRFPTVMEFLLAGVWEDGTSRVTGTITLSYEGGMLKMCLNDRDGETYTFLSSRSFTTLLQAAEKGLGTGDLDWRASKYTKGTRKAK